MFWFGTFKGEIRCSLIQQNLPFINSTKFT